MAKRVHIGDLLFDESTGEIFRMGEHETERVARLAPQPAEFLALMVASHPDITSHETIQETLWPGVGADFENSMHFCVRKIRSALGDRADSPKYIQTIPRRGYRFVDEIEIKVVDSVEGRLGINGELDVSLPNTTKTLAPESKAHLPESEPIRPLRKTRIQHRGLTLTLVVVVGLSLLWVIQQSRPDKRPLRVAVMTFEPAKAVSDPSLKNEIAELLVDRLTNSTRMTLHVIGPTTTGSFEGSPQRLDDLCDTYDIDFLINGRFSNRKPNLFLAEIIRTTDRAQLWVRKLDVSEDHDRTPAMLETGLYDVLSGIADGPGRRKRD